MKEQKFAPTEIFEQMLEWGVIPTFDLVIYYGDLGFITVRRTIPPYQNKWALPGLRQFKGERYTDTLKRVARQEVGLDVDLSDRIFLGQYDGIFTSEHHRQDISTGYLVTAHKDQPINLNPKHFSRYLITQDAPKNMGAMYRFYWDQASQLLNK